ncbi:hypothetical protein H5410_028121 [Solanum commersonii]|uniref:Retrotransposon gag domain-containing protein n=1 Tax=Solanum commersonii TaxID=4109 RepID=A0A9J5Z352_SOLCO|nr:hypothetical protein H5410_028121 [Solanum commersonii]
MHPDVELPEGYKLPKFELFNGIGDPKAHLRMYCDKLVGVGRDERILMKLFMRSLTRETLSWYIEQDPRKWDEWVDMATNFMNSIWTWAQLRICNMTNMFSLRKNHPSSHPMIWTISPHPIPTHTLSQQLSSTRLNFDALQYEGIRDKMEKSKLDAIQQKLHDLEKKFNTKIDLTLLDLLEVRKLNHESFEEYVIRWRIKASKIHHLPNEEELVQTLIRSLDGIYYKTLLIRIEKELEYDIQSGRIVDEQIHFQVLKNPSDERSKNVSTIPLKPSNQNTEQVHAIFDSYDMRFKPYNLQVSLHKVRKPRVFTPLMETLTRPLDNNNCNPSTSNTIIVQGDPTGLYSRHLTRKRKLHQRN